MRHRKFRPTRRLVIVGTTALVAGALALTNPLAEAATSTPPTGAGGYALAGDGRTAAGPAVAAAAAGPPARAKFDYQIGGSYDPPSGVRVVSRDRLDSPAEGLYNICYVNGFQTQPGRDGEEGDNAWFQEPERRHLLLRRNNGRLFEDPDWPGEIMFDIRTDSNRRELADIVGGWIAGCRTSGFDAVEIDNLDTFTRSFVEDNNDETYLSEDDAKEYAKLLIAKAHARNLAIAQKNTLDLGSAGRQIGFDFAIVEECGEFDECGDYHDDGGRRCSSSSTPIPASALRATNCGVRPRWCAATRTCPRRTTKITSMPPVDPSTR